MIKLSDQSGNNEGKTNPQFRPLRIWPALMLVALMFAARFVPMLIEGGLEDFTMVAVMGPMLCSLLLILWWLTVSRATWRERILGLLGIVAAIFLISNVLDNSVNSIAAR